MIVIKDDIKNIELGYETSIALGMFDGLHIAHQKIIKKAVEWANKNNTKSVVLTFDKHPEEILFNLNQKIIMDNYTKARLIQNLGVDNLILLKTDLDLLNLDYKYFIKFICEKLKAKFIVCGFDYRFGKKAQGTASKLIELSKIYNYDIDVIDEVKIDNYKVSSSIIREKLSCGLIDEVNNLLGYNFCIYGKVEGGNRIAREFGYPTANVYIDDNLAIKNGVYITTTIVDDKEYKSITNIGYKPTFNHRGRVLETHIFDFNKDLYNKDICVKFKKFIRDEQKFNSVSELKNRIEKDVLLAKNM